MIQAELHGKLPEVENKEDCLTSMVFGLISYLDFRDCMLKFLRKTRDYSKERKSMVDRCPSDLNYYGMKKIIFWPRSSKHGEPDIVVILKPEKNEEELLFVVEVKYQSGKSSNQEDDDQLKRYFKALSSAEFRKYFKNEDIRYFSGKFIGLIYLTEGVQRREVEESIKWIRKGGIIKNCEEMIFELRWEDITKVTEPENIISQPNKRIFRDLKALLFYKGFNEFDGIPNINEELEKELSKSNKSIIYGG